MRYLAAIAAAMVVAVSGCGSDEPPTAPQIGGQLGCASIFKDTTHELYVTAKYDCVYPDLVRGDEGIDGTYGYRRTQIYMFADNEARDSWRMVAEHFGTVVVTEGDGWLEVK